MYTHMHMCTHVTTCICKNIQYYRTIESRTHIRICICVCMYMYTYACVCVYMYQHVFACVFVYTYMGMCLSHTQFSQQILVFICVHTCMQNIKIYIYIQNIFMYIYRKELRTHARTILPANVRCQ